MNTDEMKALAERTVKTALSKGAHTAEAGVATNSRFSVTVRNGEIENLTESRSSRIAVTVSVDKRKSSATSSDMSWESIDRLVGEAVELASVMDPDEYFGLPEKDELGTAGGDLGIFDPETEAVDTDRKIAIAFELEKTACGMDERIISDGASFSNGIYSRAFANSLGFCGGYRQTYNSIDVSCAAEDGTAEGENTGKKQSSYWFSSSSSFEGLDPPAEVAGTAVERTLRKLGAVKPKTCEVPVVFDSVTARDFLGSLASAVNGRNIYRKSSFLVDMIGRETASPLITIVDDPHLTGRLGSRPFDAEGVRTRRNVIMEKGKLLRYLLSSYQGRKLSMPTSGSAGGTSNFYMKEGDSPLEDIIASVDNGLFLTSLSGPGANWTTGDFSQGAQGIWIKGGELAYPVAEFTIASTFRKMLSKVEMVGDSLEWKTSVASPPFKVGSMTISGS